MNSSFSFPTMAGESCLCAWMRGLCVLGIVAEMNCIFRRFFFTEQGQKYAIETFFVTLCSTRSIENLPGQLWSNTNRTSVSRISTVGEETNAQSNLRGICFLGSFES